METLHQANACLIHPFLSFSSKLHGFSRADFFSVPSDGPSTGLFLSPDALVVTGANQFFHYSSVGYDIAPNGYDAWSIANYWSWNSTKYLHPVWDQGACGERNGCWGFQIWMRH